MHGQVVVCPGINDGAVLDDTLLGVLDRFPRLATLGVVPLGVSAHSHEPEMRPHTTAEAQAVVDIVHVWQSRFAGRARSPLGVRLRRVLPPRGTRVPAARRVRRLPPARERHRHGAHLRSRARGRARRRRGRADRYAVRLLRGGRRRARRGLPRRARRWRERSRREQHRAAAPDARGMPADRHRHRRDGRARCSRRSCPRSARTRAPRSASSPSRTVSSAATSASPVCSPAPTSRPRSADQPAGDRYLLPDVMLSRGAFLDGETVAVLPRPVEVVATDGASLVRAVSS